MKKETQTNRQLQAQNTKSKLYKVSIELLEKQGYEQIKIEDICKKAGVSVGSFYNYFNSKNDILIEVYRRADNYFESEIKNKITSVDGLDKVIEFFDYYGIYNELVGIDIMKQLYHANNKLFPQKGRYMQALLQEIILEGQNNNEIICNMTPEEICDYLFIAARGIVYDWCLHNGTYDIKASMHKYISFFVNVFKAK